MGIKSPRLDLQRVPTPQWETPLAQTSAREAPEHYAFRGGKGRFSSEELTFEKSTYFHKDEPTDVCVRTNTGYSYLLGE